MEARRESARAANACRYRFPHRLCKFAKLNARTVKWKRRNGSVGRQKSEVLRQKWSRTRENGLARLEE